MEQKATPATPAFMDLCKEASATLLEMATKIIADGEMFPPLLFIKTVTGEIKMVRAPLTSPGHKDRVAFVQRMIATDPVVAVICFATEAWMVSATADERKEIEGSLEHVPGRIEAIMLNFMKDGMQVFCKAEIKRPSNTLAEPTFIDLHSTLSDGRFVLDREMAS